MKGHAIMNRIRNFLSIFFKKHFLESTFITKWDYLAIGVLTLIFTILVFYRIGNTSAPQSAYTATAEERDIVIDLRDYVEVGSIHMFLGNLNTRKFSISAFNEVAGTWDVLQGESTAESVFAWNTIAINYNLRYLGIVALDEECVINELVLTSPDGAILSPVYDAKYSALFDEQDLFPAVKTYLTGTMFDEVYHGRTAYEFIHGLVTYVWHDSVWLAFYVGSFWHFYGSSFLSLCQAALSEYLCCNSHNDTSGV